MLMNEVWDENWFGSTKTLDVTIGRLRSKLEAPASPSGSSRSAAWGSASRPAVFVELVVHNLYPTPVSAGPSAG